MNFWISSSTIQNINQRFREISARWTSVTSDLHSNHTRLYEGNYRAREYREKTLKKLSMQIERQISMTETLHTSLDPSSSVFFGNHEPLVLWHIFWHNLSKALTFSSFFVQVDCCFKIKVKFSDYWIHRRVIYGSFQLQICAHKSPLQSLTVPRSKIKKRVIFVGVLI